MKLNAAKLGISAGLAFAIIWFFCSLFVWLLPTAMMDMSGHMVHGAFEGMTWHITASGVVLGLIAWTFVAGVTSWLIAVIYNKSIE